MFTCTTGLVVAANDAAALADGITAFLDKAKLAAMGASARARVQHRSFEQVFFTYLWSVYEDSDSDHPLPSVNTTGPTAHSHVASLS